MAALNSVDEKERLVKLQAGSEQAFDQIFHDFYPSLCYFANRILGGQPIAEEIVQDALFRLWEKHSDFYSYQSIKAFLYICTKNGCYNHIKKERVKANHEQTIIDQYTLDEETVLNRI